MNKQFLLLLDGMMGAGKTTTTSILKEQLPRTAIIGMDRIKKFVSDFERNERDNNIARAVTIEMAKKYLELGLSVIVDQPFWDSADIQQYETIAKDHSVSFYKYSLFTTPEIAYQRAIARQQDWEYQLPEDRIKEVIALYKRDEALGLTAIDTTNLPIDGAAKLIMEEINK